MRLDGERRWPSADSRVPAERRSAPSTTGQVRVLFGSCRTAAPHEPPWTLEMAARPDRPRRRRPPRPCAAHARPAASSEWPDLAVMLGDQVYADDSSPATRERIKARRDERSGRGPAARAGGRLRGVLLAVPRVVVARRRALVLLGRADGDDLRRPRHDRRLEHLGLVGPRHPSSSRGGTTTSSAAWSRTGSTSTSGT